MVEIISIGVLSIQGSVSEHIKALNSIFKNKSIIGKTTLVKHKKDLEALDALIIPGGESTTISKILNKTGLYDSIVSRIADGNLWIMGTCAGCVLLAKKTIGNRYRNKRR